MNICNCGGHNIKHEERVGRGSPPKGWVRKMGDNRRISWKGIWDIWACLDCGKESKQLRET